MSNQALSLYRQLLRHSNRLAAYNFRNYAVRRTKDAFRGNKNLPTDQGALFLEQGLKELEVLKRQATISQMYAQESEKLVVEK